MAVEKRLDHYWYTSGPVSFILWPVSWLFTIVAKARKIAQTARQKPLPDNIPLIVVGNISVGGTGKTPMVIWLANMLKAYGMSPGIVSRGYGGSSLEYPQKVTRKSNPLKVGDEPVVIARSTLCPVYVDPNRLQAIDHMVRENMVDIIISDDGMQHYKMPRNLEIVMIDGIRRFGNHCCLPAGPLREPVSRLKSVDFKVVTSGDKKDDDEYTMQLQGTELVNVRDPAKSKQLKDFRRHQVHAVAGIGSPIRFFTTLTSAGVEVVRHPFPDHHIYKAADLKFTVDLPIIMTEKDAIKCAHLVGDDVWYLPVKAKLGHDFATNLIHKIKAIQRGQTTA